MGNATGNTMERGKNGLQLPVRVCEHCGEERRILRFKSTDPWFCRACWVLHNDPDQSPGVCCRTIPGKDEASPHPSASSEKLTACDRCGHKRRTVHICADDKTNSNSGDWPAFCTACWLQLESQANFKDNLLLACNDQHIRENPSKVKRKAMKETAALRNRRRSLPNVVKESCADGISTQEESGTQSLPALLGSTWPRCGTQSLPALLPKLQERTSTYGEGKPNKQHELTDSQSISASRKVRPRRTKIVPLDDSVAEYAKPAMATLQVTSSPAAWASSQSSPRSPGALSSPSSSPRCANTSSPTWYSRRKAKVQGKTLLH